jgi:predicted DNA binding CopG/RHH family protein
MKLRKKESFLGLRVSKEFHTFLKIESSKRGMSMSKFIQLCVYVYQEKELNCKKVIFVI